MELKLTKKEILMLLMILQVDVEETKDRDLAHIFNKILAQYKTQFKE